MKKYLFINSTFIFLLIGSIVLFNTSCTSCQKETPGEEPELPPVSSLVMDFSDFDSRPDEKGTTYANFVYSYLNVVFWHTISSSTLALPATAYGHMLSQDAVYLGDNVWQWEDDFTFDQTTYVATLTATRLNDDEFSVEMVIAEQASPDQGFKWFDGIVKYNHTSASWNVYKHNGGSPVKILEVDWTKDENSSSLLYVYVEPGQQETGSSISFGIDPALEYDAWYTITLSSETIQIEWDRATKAGRVKNPDHFTDSDWHCWDAYLADTDCV